MKLTRGLGIRHGMSLLLLASLVLSVAAVVSLSEPAEAQTRCGTEFYYYSDPGMTDLVGVFLWTPWSCGCTFHSWGTFGPYREVRDGFC